MDTNNVIIYYTHNKLPAIFLRATTAAAQTHSVNEKSELIIVSQFPILKKYERINMGPLEVPNQNYNCLELDGTGKNIVTGYLKADNKYEQMLNIYKQIGTGMAFSECQNPNDNIIFMEHDCFYPATYIKGVQEALEYAPFCYTSFNHILLDQYGYIGRMPNGSYYLSGCAGKRKELERFIDTRIEILSQAFEEVKANGADIESYFTVKKLPFCFEPLLDIIKKMIYPNSKINLLDYEIKRHVCSDRFIGAPVLDIIHDKNTSRGKGWMDYLISYKEENNVLNDVLSDTSAKKRYLMDDYWGEASKYWKLFI